MRWINLVDDQPPVDKHGFAYVTARLIGNHVPVDTITLFTRMSKGVLGGIEWLDESAEQYLMELPTFGSWKDVEELIEADDTSEHPEDEYECIEWLAARYPHGFKVGTRYIYK